jgi:hypothetical protein
MVDALGVKVYASWQSFVWWLAFDAQAPDVFARAGRRRRQIAALRFAMTLLAASLMVRSAPLGASICENL